MIILRSKIFSRKKEPKGIEKYKDYKEEDFDKMTRGQKLAALEEEDETANRNTNRYIVSKLGKYGLPSAGAGLIAGAVFGPKGTKVSSALSGAIGAGVIGGTVGALRGNYLANKRGHNRDKRTIALARRMDERARKTNRDDDDYEYRVKDSISRRKTEEAARSAAFNSAMAASNSYYYR